MASLVIPGVGRPLRAPVAWCLVNGIRDIGPVAAPPGAPLGLRPWRLWSSVAPRARARCVRVLRGTRDGGLRIRALLGVPLRVILQHAVLAISAGCFDSALAAAMFVRERDGLAHDWRHPLLRRFGGELFSSPARQSRGYGRCMGGGRRRPAGRATPSKIRSVAAHHLGRLSRRRRPLPTSVLPRARSHLPRSGAARCVETGSLAVVRCTLQTQAGFDSPLASSILRRLHRSQEEPALDIGAVLAHHRSLVLPLRSPASRSWCSSRRNMPVPCSGLNALTFRHKASRHVAHARPRNQA